MKIERWYDEPRQVVHIALLKQAHAVWVKAGDSLQIEQRLASHNADVFEFSHEMALGLNEEKRWQGHRTLVACGPAFEWKGIRPHHASHELTRHESRSSAHGAWMREDDGKVRVIVEARYRDVGKHIALEQWSVRRNL